MKNTWLTLIIIFYSCSADQKINIVLESELEQSRSAMEANLNSKFACYKKMFIDSDSTYDPSQPKGHAQLFYRDFSKLKNSRDSIARINTGLTKMEWMSIVFQFSQRATKLSKNQTSKKEIEEDLKFLNENLHDIPESEFGELYKHIIERWTAKTYESVPGKVAIDFIEGQQSRCPF